MDAANLMPKNKMVPFDYDMAFSRSLGWITATEMGILKNIRIGIAGLGGVGGQYAEILTRMGIQNFVLADFDTFSMENSNRQNECKTTNYGRNKAEVAKNLILDINPGAQVECWTEGLSVSNLNQFCQSIDIYVDGLDFFEIKLRCLLFEKLGELGKTAITSAPVGTGASMLVFAENSMSFLKYFGIHKQDSTSSILAKFIAGLDASMHLTYMADTNYLNIHSKKTPSTPMGVYSCASLVATTVLKVALKRGPILKAPWIYHYDPYLLKTQKSYIWLGSKNPLQMLKVMLINKRLALAA